MNNKILWLVVSGLMVLSLAMAACGPAAAPSTPPTPTAPTAPTTPTTPGEEKPQKEAVKPAVEAPKYGGQLNVRWGATTSWDPFSTSIVGGANALSLTNLGLWVGDWAKGPAGGFGADETTWTSMNANDRFDHKTGYIAEGWKWTFDEAKGNGAIVYQIRRGIRYALNPASEASRLANGREVTADDVVFAMKTLLRGNDSDFYRRNPSLRTAKITKSGPWEVTVQLPVEALIVGISRFGNNVPIAPPEVWEKYGKMADWRNSVGSGPFMITELVAGSSMVFVRNNNFWMKDPVGPGKGNQLPYLDRIKSLEIPDKSTLYAAMRTGKIDVIDSVPWEDAIDLRRTAPKLREVEQELSNVNVTGTLTAAVRYNTTVAPFNDVRVRQAMLLATDLDTINKTLGGGLGQILTQPFSYSKSYADLYLPLNDPQMPQSVRELFVYSPDKAKALLKEAGYPQGFKTSAIIPGTPTAVVDFYSILKDMWAKVGIDLTLDVRESAVVSNIQTSRAYQAIIHVGGRTSPAIFYNASHLTGEAESNASLINDPVINKAWDEIRTVALTDMVAAMKLVRKITPYILEQVYFIPIPLPPIYNFWWPWLKNYSGEFGIGYSNVLLWVSYVWIDQNLKKSMGY